MERGELNSFLAIAKLLLLVPNTQTDTDYTTLNMCSNRPHLALHAVLVIQLVQQYQSLCCCRHYFIHCESSQSSFDECRLSIKWPLALIPGLAGQCLPVGC